MSDSASRKELADALERNAAELEKAREQSEADGAERRQNLEDLNERLEGLRAAEEERADRDEESRAELLQGIEGRNAELQATLRTETAQQRENISNAHALQGDRLRARANELLHSDMAAEASETIVEALKLDPSNPRTQLDASRIFAAADNPGQARIHLDKGIKLLPIRREPEYATGLLEWTLANKQFGLLPVLLRVLPGNYPSYPESLVRTLASKGLISEAIAVHQEASRGQGLAKHAFLGVDLAVLFGQNDPSEEYRRLLAETSGAELARHLRNLSGQLAAEKTISGVARGLILQAASERYVAGWLAELSRAGPANRYHLFAGLQADFHDFGFLRSKARKIMTQALHEAYRGWGPAIESDLRNQVAAHGQKTIPARRVRTWLSVVTGAAIGFAVAFVALIALLITTEGNSLDPRFESGGLLIAVGFWVIFPTFAWLMQRRQRQRAASANRDPFVRDPVACAAWMNDLRGAEASRTTQLVPE